MIWFQDINYNNKDGIVLVSRLDRSCLLRNAKKAKLWILDLTPKIQKIS